MAVLFWYLVKSDTGVTLPCTVANTGKVQGTRTTRLLLTGHPLSQIKNHKKNLNLFFRDP